MRTWICLDRWVHLVTHSGTGGLEDLASPNEKGEGFEVYVQPPILAKSSKKWESWGKFRSGS